MKRDDNPIDLRLALLIGIAVCAIFWGSVYGIWVVLSN